MQMNPCTRQPGARGFCISEGLGSAFIAVVNYDETRVIVLPVQFKCRVPGPSPQGRGPMVAHPFCHTVIGYSIGNALDPYMLITEDFAAAESCIHWQGFNHCVICVSSTVCKCSNVGLLVDLWDTFKSMTTQMRANTVLWESKPLWVFCIIWSYTMVWSSFKSRAYSSLSDLCLQKCVSAHFHTKTGYLPIWMWQKIHVKSGHGVQYTQSQFWGLQYSCQRIVKLWVAVYTWNTVTYIGQKYSCTFTAFPKCTLFIIGIIIPIM